MPRVRELLYRFRPAGAPGPASAAGVPADRRADVTAELESVFAQLEDTTRECAALRDKATREAAAIRMRGSERARAVRAAAEARVPAERAAARATAQRRTEEESAARIAEAEQATRALREHMAPLVPQYVARAVDLVNELLGTPS